MPPQHCPVCHGAALLARYVDRPAWDVTCPRCGRYDVTAHLLRRFETAREERLEDVLAHMVDLPAILKAAAEPLTLTDENWVPPDRAG